MSARTEPAQRHEVSGQGFSGPKREWDLSIKALETVKSKIPQRFLMQKKIIPRHPASVVFNGSSGSGKSTLLLNVLTRKEFFKGYFDHTFLFSPTGASDDLFKHLKLRPDHIFVDMDVKDLQKILDKQKDLIEKSGVDKAPKILIIFEDCQSNKKFMNSKPFLKSFIANRHYGCSTCLCSQSWTRTPRACRLQANNVFFFKGSGGEHELIAKEFCRPGLNKKQILSLIDDATREKHTFLHINNHTTHEKRYRRNLDEIIHY